MRIIVLTFAQLEKFSADEEIFLEAIFQINEMLNCSRLDPVYFVTQGKRIQLLTNPRRFEWLRDVLKLKG